QNEETFFDWRRDHAVTIGHDVWIGHGAIVLAGRTVGTGAVVGAGAVVTKDVAPYTVVGGTPAKVIRRRFSEEIEDKLMALAWWDW
ncbi:antibiotic acetyltransferase, partial [Mycobacterium tuberculosis]|nr:antibiotic acetyltransferase [Mycobacterium tuberculosis]